MSDITLAQTIQSVRQCEEVALQVHQQGEASAAVQEIAWEKQQTEENRNGNPEENLTKSMENQNVEDVG